MSLLSCQTGDSNEPASCTGDIVLKSRPGTADVPDPELRRRIVATGLPWSIRDRVSGIELVLIPPGTYTRGAHPEDRLALPREKPGHRVRIQRAFYLGRFEVTTAQYRRFKPPFKTPKVPWWRGGPAIWDTRRPIEKLVLNGPKLPIIYVSWIEATTFCKAHGMRLPTEAEWEYAARAGTSTPYPWGTDPRLAPTFANGYDPATERALRERRATFPVADAFRGSAPVGSFKPNGFGLHDVIGNAVEWCSDWYSAETYAVLKGKQQVDPRGPAAGQFRVVRGGSWYGGPSLCRVSARTGSVPDHLVNVVGFRVVRDVEPRKAK